MSTRLLALLAVLISSGVGVSGQEAQQEGWINGRPPARDYPQHFHGTAVGETILTPQSLMRVRWTAGCEVQDLPNGSDFNNHFRLIFHEPRTVDGRELTPSSFYLPQSGDWVTVAASATQDGRGVMLLESPLWGKVECMPMDSGVERIMLNTALRTDGGPTSETLPQTFELRGLRREDGTVPSRVYELLITEHKADHRQGIISAEWQILYEQTQRLLGKGRGSTFSAPPRSR